MRRLTTQDMLKVLAGEPLREESRPRPQMTTLEMIKGYRETAERTVRWANGLLELTKRLDAAIADPSTPVVKFLALIDEYGSYPQAGDYEAWEKEREKAVAAQRLADEILGDLKSTID